MSKQSKSRLLSLIEPKRFIEYMISGGAYFWFGYLVFFLCDAVLHLNLWWSKLIANILGWTLNYVLQRYWVFSDRKGKAAPMGGRYAVLTLTDFVLDFLIVAGLAAVGISPYIGQFVSSAFFTGWNYVWYKWWVFPAKYVHHHSHRKRSA